MNITVTRQASGQASCNRTAKSWLPPGRTA